MSNEAQNGNFAKPMLQAVLSLFDYYHTKNWVFKI
jgi:hypothetical protein